MLFELFHKAVNEDLTEKRKEGDHQEIVENAVVVVDEGEDGQEMAGNEGEDER